MTMINSLMPEFKLNAYKKGEGFITVDSKDLAGKWVVIMTYPADFTFVCPTELADLQDYYAELRKLGVEVFSLSTDSHFVHKAWADATETINKLEYPMLADPTGNLCRALNIMCEEDGMAYRGTYVYNPKGVLKVIEMHDNGIGRDASELLRKIKAAIFVEEHPDAVCPAKWKEGAEVLRPSIDLVGKI